MRIFTLILYLLLGIVISWFAAQNWDRTVLWLPGGFEAYWPLGAYIITALVIGILPTAILHSLSRWRWQRKVRKLEAKLDALGQSGDTGMATGPAARMGDYAPAGTPPARTPTL